jgi:hypothetical protein
MLEELISLPLLIGKIYWICYRLNVGFGLQVVERCSWKTTGYLRPKTNRKAMKLNRRESETTHEISKNGAHCSVMLN